jgi:hypothetical protein
VPPATLRRLRSLAERTLGNGSEIERPRGVDRAVGSSRRGARRLAKWGKRAPPWQARFVRLGRIPAFVVSARASTALGAAAIAACAVPTATRHATPKTPAAERSGSPAPSEPTALPDAVAPTDDAARATLRETAVHLADLDHVPPDARDDAWRRDAVDTSVRYLSLLEADARARPTLPSQAEELALHFDLMRAPAVHAQWVAMLLRWSERCFTEHTFPPRRCVELLAVHLRHDPTNGELVLALGHAVRAADPDPDDALLVYDVFAAAADAKGPRPAACDDPDLRATLAARARLPESAARLRALCHPR